MVLDALACAIGALIVLCAAFAFSSKRYLLAAGLAVLAGRVAALALP